MSLRGGRVEYGFEQRFANSSASMPQSLVNARRAKDLLGQDACRYLQYPEQILRVRTEVEPQVCVPYWDPQLRSDSGMYRRFVRKSRAAEYFIYLRATSQMLLWYVFR